MASRTKETVKAGSEIAVQNLILTLHPPSHLPSNADTEATSLGSCSRLATNNPSATRTSPCNTNEANNDDIIKRARKACADLRNKGSLQQKVKDNITTVIENLIEKAKGQPTTNATHVEEASTETANLKATTVEAATQTEGPNIAVNETDLNAVDKKMNLVINILTKDKTYTQTVTAAPRPTTQQLSPAKERLNKARQDRAQYEINLTMANAPKDTQELIRSSSYKEIIRRFQETIDKAELGGKPKLEDVKKLSRGVIRIQATTKEGAKTIREANINWEEAYTGIKIYKRQCGIVIHGVPVWAINLEPGYEETKEYKDTINDWQRENASRNNITIASIIPLVRKTKIGKTHQSIIVTMEDAEAADRCIINHFFIESQSFEAEKYAPQYRLRQCYKCQEFGHTANKCKNNSKCGKCAFNHPTVECSSDEHKCINCGGNHEAWHKECLVRSIVGDKVQEERETNSPFFCQ